MATPPSPAPKPTSVAGPASTVGLVSRYSSTAPNTYGPVTPAAQQQMNAWALYWSEAQKLTGVTTAFPLSAGARPKTQVLTDIDQMTLALASWKAPMVAPVTSTKMKVGLAVAAFAGLAVIGAITVLASKDKQKTITSR